MESGRDPEEWPSDQRFAWRRIQDEAERTVWVDRYQTSSHPLGRIIAKVMIDRDQHWQGPGPLVPKAALVPREEAESSGRSSARDADRDEGKSSRGTKRRREEKP